MRTEERQYSSPNKEEQFSQRSRVWKEARQGPDRFAFPVEVLYGAERTEPSLWG